MLFSMLSFQALSVNGTEVESNLTSKHYNYGTILQYHHVNTTTPAITSISPDKFKEHLDLIQAEGFSVLPLDTMIQNIKIGAPFDKKTLAFTFDDNYRSIYDNAFPLLKERNWPFTVFVNPKTIREDASAVNEDFILSWAQLKEMKDNGATIANHTQNHWHLLQRNELESNEEWGLRIKNDIESAQQTIEQHLGNTPKWIAYPYGEFDTNLKDLLNQMGYLAFSQQSGGINKTTNWQSIPRFPASGIYANLATLKIKLNSQPFDVFSVHPENTIRLTGNPAPTLELIVSKKDVIRSQVSCYFSGEKIVSEATIEDERLIISAHLEGVLPFGRSRYNCTARSKKGHYFWYSMPFITTNKHGQWQE